MVGDSRLLVVKSLWLPRATHGNVYKNKHGCLMGIITFLLTLLGFNN